MKSIFLLYLIEFYTLIWSPRSGFSWSGSSSPSSSQQNKVLPTALTRRDWLIASGIAGVSTLLQQPDISRAADIPPSLADEYYKLPVATNPAAGQSYFPALTPPFQNRATYRYTLGRDSWAFEQLLTFANVTATIRCNVIKLQKTGGLWVHSPQWPTGEFCSLLDDLGAPVEHVVLPCNAFEHKAPMQAFLKKYPKAQVWVSPGQFGPLGSCGKTLADKNSLGYKIDGIFGPGNPLPPWADEFDIATLYVELPKNAGPVSEVAFCHRPTKTLVATDAVVYIPSGKAPDIFSTYFRDPTITNDPTFWPRSVLQAVFLPLRTDDDETGESYPGYIALQNRLVRAPILRALVDARAPDSVREWIQEQTKTSSSGNNDNNNDSWQFDRIITSHFASPIQASPADVRAAFDYLFEDDPEKLSSSLPPVACQDWELLDSINQFVAKTNAGAPAVFDFTKGCRNEQ